jgi:hypothetical protein
MLISLLKKWFGPKSEADYISLLKKEPVVFYVGGGWGNAINWNDVEGRRVVGWKFNPPEVGDELRSQMQSGKIGRFVFVNIDRPGDPPDMFFADVALIGYTDGSPLPIAKA